MLKYIFLLLFISFSSSSKIYDTLLNWGIKKGLTISNKIEMQFNSVNDKYYVANTTIEEGELIMKLPYDILFTIENTYPNASEKLQKVYKNLSSVYEKTETRVEQIFLSLLLYYSKEKPHKQYKSFIRTFQNHLDSVPIFYTDEQINLLLNTSLGGQVEISRYSLDDEIYNIKQVTGGDINIDKYYKYRALTVSKSLNVNGHIALIPFIDFLNIHPYDFNIEYVYNEEVKEIAVRAAKPIEKGEILTLKIEEISNCNALMFYGKTFENNDFLETYSLPIFHPRWLIEHNLDAKEFDITYNRMDLVKEDFDKDAMTLYQVLCQSLNIGVNDENAYQLMYDNLKRYLEDYGYVKENDYYREFYNRKDAVNVIRVVDKERRLLSSRVNYIREKLQKIKEKGEL